MPKNFSALRAEEDTLFSFLTGFAVFSLFTTRRWSLRSDLTAFALRATRAQLFTAECLHYVTANIRFFGVQ